MTIKSVSRIHPYLKKSELRGDIVKLSIFTFIMIGVVIGMILSRKSDPGGGCWVPFILGFMGYVYLLFTELPYLIVEIYAYKNQSNFLGSSLTANAEILEKSKNEDRDWYYLTISFTANTRAKGVQQQNLSINVPYALYQKVSEGETAVVRYSTENPQIAILAGETGGDDGAVVSEDNATSTHPEDREPPNTTQDQKLGIIAVEGYDPKIYQAYKLYAENGWLYGACILKTNEKDGFPLKKIHFYDRLDLNSDNFLTEDKYNFRYALGHIGSIRVSTKKRNYVGTPIVGKLIIRLMGGKERTFWLASDIEQAKEILRKAGFVVE